MPQRYWLPCSCGRQLQVEAGQAGLRISCACGQALKVPPLRELSELLPVGEQAETRGAWGRRGRLITLGLVLLAVGGSVLVGLWLTRPIPPAGTVDMERIESLSLVEAWELWPQLSQGIEAPHVSHVWELYELKASRYRRWMWVGGALAAVGAMLLTGGLLIKSDPSEPRP